MGRIEAMLQTLIQKCPGGSTGSSLPEPEPQPERAAAESNSIRGALLSYVMDSSVVLIAFKNVSTP